jgi:hypothetical protein
MSFIGCQKSELLDNSKNNPVNDGKESFKNSGIAAMNADIEYCGTPLVGSLVDYAQTIPPGIVTVGNDANFLYVTYNITGDWWIKNATLYAGPAADIPGVINPDGTGSFYQWLFPYYYYPWDLIQTHTFQIDLNSLVDCFVVVAYANLRNIATGQDNMYAWGKSPLKNNGFYMEYCKQQCAPPPPLGGCETAYAFGETYANCFLNIPGVNSNNWGWSNGPISAGAYSWPIYAGAGQCNLENGILVGTLNVNYTPPTIIVTYSMLNGYVLNTTHLYVGNQILPKKNNKYTTAPGQFPYKHESLNGVSSDSFTINGISGNIYVVAHSEACDDI